jgi:hypothetical protein
MPFATISFKESRIAKTSVKSSVSPFWGEEFYFDDLPNCIDEIRIGVYYLVKKRETELGYVEIQLSTILDSEVQGRNHFHKKSDFWLTLKPANNFNSNIEEGSAAIRVCAMLSDETVMPLNEYPLFLNSMFSEDFRVLKTLASTTERGTSFARDDFAKSLVSVLTATETDITGLRALLSVEVDATEDPNIIFRGNSLATKAVDQYMKLVGSEFLKNTLSQVIKQVFERASKQESCEVDPTRLDSMSEEMLKKHQKRLLGWVDLFWNAIQSSADKIPSNFRETMQSIREMVTKSFLGRTTKPGASNNQVQFSAVSGFIFLRFFCPAILNPKLFGLWPEISENSFVTRTLTLVAKVLQNLANLSDFKSKEPHMEFCNQWILWNMDNMKTYILQFSTLRPQDLQNDQRYGFLLNYKDIDLSREFNALYLYISHSYTDLRAQYEDLVKEQAEVPGLLGVREVLRQGPLELLQRLARHAVCLCQSGLKGGHAQLCLAQRQRRFGDGRRAGG